jgi:hypothetical protein
MFRGLYYTLFYFPDIRNANGLIRFGERCINSLLGRAKRRSASARKRTIRLEIERENVEEYLKGIQRNRLLEDNEYFGIRKKVQTGTLFIAGIFLTECLLAYYSTLVLINGSDLDTALLRWLLAIALTLGAITTSDKLLESCLPLRYRDEEATSGKSIPVIILWSVLLALVLLGVVAVAEARVRDIEGGRTGSIVYYGFIALSTVLPLIAGTIAWEISRYYDSYKQTRRYRTALRRLQRLTLRVGQNIQEEKEAYSAMLTIYWNRYNDFRSCKENHDQNHRTNGSAAEIPSYDFEEFKRVSAMRYGPVRQDRIHTVHGVLSGKLLHIPQDAGESSYPVETSYRAIRPEAFLPEEEPNEAEKSADPPPVRSAAKKRMGRIRHAVKRTLKRAPKRRRKAG